MEIVLIVAVVVVWVAMAVFFAKLWAADERAGLTTFLIVLFCGPLASIILILGEARAANWTKTNQNIQSRPYTPPADESGGGLPNGAAWALTAGILVVSALIAAFYAYMVYGN